jgi:hypothetical protein
VCVFLCLCTGRGLATSWSPVQGVLPTVLDLATEMKGKVSWRRPRPELGSRAKGKISDCRRSLDLWMDLSTPYTHGSELHVIRAPPLIPTIYKSTQHPLSLYQHAVSTPVVPWQRLLTVDILQLHALTPLLVGHRLATELMLRRASRDSTRIPPTYTRTALPQFNQARLYCISVSWHKINWLQKYRYERVCLVHIN